MNLAFIIFIIVILIQNMLFEEFHEMVVFENTEVIVASDKNSSIHYQMLQIFAFSGLFAYYENNLQAEINNHLSNQYYKLLPNNGQNFSVFLTGNNLTIYTRVVKFGKIFPGIVSKTENFFQIELTIDPRQSDLTEIEYNVHIVSIFPYGKQFVWAADPIDLKRQWLNAINNSNSMEFISQNGKHIIKRLGRRTSPEKIKINNRPNRHFLIIVVLVINETTVINTPIMIVGCGNKPTDPCPIFKGFPITGILVVICMVVICGFRTYLAYVFFFGWIILSYCLFLIWGWAQEEFPFTDQTVSTVAILGALLILIWVGILFKFTDRVNKKRAIATAAILIVIFISLCSFFLFQGTANIFITGLLGIIVATPFILLTYYFTSWIMVFGAVLAIITCIGVSVASALVNGSMVPYIFVDVYGFLVKGACISHAIMLKNDIVMLVLIPIVSLAVGAIAMVYYKFSLLERMIRWIMDNIITPTAPPMELERVPPIELERVPPIELGRVPPIELGRVPPIELGRVPPIELERVPPVNVEQVPSIERELVPEVPINEGPSRQQ